MKKIKARFMTTGEQWLENHTLYIDDRGTVQDIRLEDPTPETVSFPDSLILPGCVNTHSHAFQVFLRGSGCQPLHFQDWVDRHLYPLVMDMTPERLYASALLAFGEMLQAGITTVGEFFYIHNRPDGSSSENEYERAVLQAAMDIGIRIAFLRSLYDQGLKAGQRCFRESVGDAIRRTLSLAEEYHAHPRISVLPAPHSLHGASRDMIVAGAKLADQLDTKYHIHLAEQPSDVRYAQKQYGSTPVQTLDKWGILNERTVLVHGIWLEQDEKELMGSRGAGLAYNPLTNMALGDGIADLLALQQQGICISLGTDANNQLDLFAEARCANYLQRVQQLEMGLQSTRDVFRMLHINGGRNLGLPVGTLRPGSCADFIVIDLQALSILPGPFQSDQEMALLNHVLFSMVPQQAISHVFVGGEAVVENRELQTVSPEQIRERVAACWQ